MADHQRVATELNESLNNQLAKLGVREERLIDLAADGLLSRAKIRERSNAIEVERVRIQAALADTSAQLEVGAQRLRACIDLVADPERLYRNSPDATRRQLNGTFYLRHFIDEGDQVTVAKDVLNPPFDEIVEASWIYQRQKSLAIGKRNPRQVGSRPQINKGRDRLAASFGENKTPVLADLFPVSVSSKRVMVEMTMLETPIRSTTTLVVYDDLTAAHAYLVDTFVGCGSARTRPGREGRARRIVRGRPVNLAAPFR
jgi:site-specific DNA recombinase